ncbi:hypothetical protein CLU96_0179 [Chryseobacterium sp. 52]|uniref:hypothetical protein n=1 Tax=Chryseobacterium sp. 52 TaxID=2035213 RepID=UPI000C4C533F|nr:hypothetical protein [Chryseobacterium sp. 52]PIF43275.1 hypothetical protein CLU96_0179 [Chryseobacterium sp. 52]
MNKKNPVLKNAQKLGRNEQKLITGGAIPNRPRYCCEWDENGKCTIWTCGNCVCP